MFISYLFMIKSPTKVLQIFENKLHFLKIILLYSLHAYIKTLENRMYKGFYAFLSLHKVPQKPT